MVTCSRTRREVIGSASARQSASQSRPPGARKCTRRELGMNPLSDRATDTGTTRRRDQLEQDHQPEAMDQSGPAAHPAQSPASQAARTVAANALLNMACTSDSMRGRASSRCSWSSSAAGGSSPAAG